MLRTISFWQESQLCNYSPTHVLITHVITQCHFQWEGCSSVMGTFEYVTSDKNKIDLHKYFLTIQVDLSIESLY